MRILILNSILYTSEKNIIPEVESIKDTMIYNFAWAFQQSGHKVTLIAAKDYLPIAKEEYPFEVIFLESNLPKIFLPSVLPLHFSIIFFLRKNKKYYDLILSSEVFSFNSLFASLILPNKTIIWQELGQHNRKMNKIPSKVWYNIVARIFMRRTLIVPRSPKAGRFLKKFHLNILPDFIDHGVNINKLHPDTLKKKQFIIISQLIPRKNIIPILHTYKRFLDKYKMHDYKLYIAGDGICREEIENCIQDEQLKDKVFLLGKLPHEELSDYLSHSTCMFCKPIQDLNMIVIGESIAVGTPVITNTVPYSHEWVRDKELGIAKDLWNEDDIYEVVKNNSKYVDNCLKFSSHLSIEFVTNEFIKLINDGKTQNFNS